MDDIVITAGLANCEECCRPLYAIFIAMSYNECELVCTYYF